MDSDGMPRPDDTAGSVTGTRRKGRPEAPRTLKDVARAAGVSPMTASRVLRGTGNVAADRRAAVQRAATALGYRSNPMARALRNSTRPSWLVALIVDDIKDPFFSRLASALEKALAPENAMLVVASTDADASRAAEVVNGLLRHDIDAFVIAPPPGDQSYLSAASALGKPILSIDRLSTSDAVPAFLSDNLGGARAAVDHLVAHGHRRIAFIGDDIGATMRERFQGYQDALRDHDIAPRPEFARLDAYAAANVPGIVRELLDLPEAPTALFTARNVTSLGTLVGLHEMGAHEDIAQVGFDDVDLSAVVEPGLTVVAQWPGDIGRQVAQHVLSEVEGHSPAGGTTTVPVSLIERGSGEIPGPEAEGGTHLAASRHAPDASRDDPAL